jgi:hypothetical protein
MISLCLTSDCKEEVEHWQKAVLPPSVSYDFTPIFGERRPYRVDSIAVPLDRLRDKLSQYPPGTTFQWSAWSHWVTREWFDDFDSPLRRAERLLPAGMHLSHR